MALLLECDPDPSTWLAVPDGWGETWDSPQEWADAVTGSLGPANGEVAGPEPEPLWTRALAAIARSRAGGGVADRSYVFLPQPVVPPVVLDIVVLPAEGVAADRHRYLARAGVEGGVGSAQVMEVTSPHLGAGTAVLRFDEVGSRGGSTRVVGVWRAVWRVGDHDVAVSLSAPSPDALLEVLPSAIALVETMRVATV